MEIKDAIQKAVEGGYNPLFSYETGDEWEVIKGENATILDVMFWKYLAREMHWADIQWYHLPPISVLGESNLTIPIRATMHEKITGAWLYHWHRLIDHLAEGGTIESYFTNL